VLPAATPFFDIFVKCWDCWLNIFKFVFITDFIQFELHGVRSALRLVNHQGTKQAFKKMSTKIWTMVNLHTIWIPVQYYRTIGFLKAWEVTHSSYCSVMFAENADRNRIENANLKPSNKQIVDITFLLPGFWSSVFRVLNLLQHLFWPKPFIFVHISVRPSLALWLTKNVTSLIPCDYSLLI